MDTFTVTAEDVFELIVENAQAEADALKTGDFAGAAAPGKTAYRLMIRYSAMTGLDLQTVRRLVSSELT